jgi:segregation and condensation protein A
VPVPETGSDWDRAAGPQPVTGTAPRLSVEGFEGPLDWLLDMVRAQKIDLGRLSILALVDAFVVALEAGLAGASEQSAPLGRWGDWLVMAATLTLLRSRLLLPADAAEAKEAEAEAETLRRRLISRAEIGAVVDWLEARPQLGREVFPRGSEDAAPTRRIGDLTELLRGCLVVLQLPEDLEPYLPRPPPFWRVTDAIARFEALLGDLPEAGRPIEAFLPRVGPGRADRDLRCRAAVASTLLGGLELARTGSLTLSQAAPWGGIQVSGEQTEAADTEILPPAR